MIRETQTGMKMIISVLDSNSAYVLQRSEINLRCATKWQVFPYTNWVSVLFRGWKVSVKDSLAKC